ncbi:MAG: hypothetical protein JRI68_19820 [Deltaproteobacteria bacterium]|nr:hypothetical protein [Deltaproteobacteria bacterium]
MMESHLSSWLHGAALAALLTTGLALPGCADPVPSSAADDLTSVTAVERELTFAGYVYVHPDATDDDILWSVHQQTRSAFGAFLTQNIAVATRELANVDPSTFVREPVTVIDAAGDPAYETLRVRYQYVDRAVVPKPMAHRSALRLGLLHGDYPAQAERVLTECSLNTAEEREMFDDVWYVFNPGLDSCKTAINAEQRAIDQQRETLDDGASQIVGAELERLYVPMTVSLRAVAGTSKRLYPEYDRLWSGGVDPNALVITLLNGMIDHPKPGQSHHPVDDPGYWEMLGEMDVILADHPDFRVVATDPPTDLSTFQIDGELITGLSFQRFIDFELYQWGFPEWLTTAQQTELRRLVAARLSHRWITLEKPVSVSIDGGVATPRTVRLQLYFGVDEEPEPYHRGIAQSDVFLYNGHSFIGEGPLDPVHFTVNEFPASYQIFFIDSCLSFNYYNSDYFAFKADGSQSLDVVSNGLESFSDGAGAGQGRFVVGLLSSETPSWVELLQLASTTGSDYAWGKDALRVVDGELDNEFKPWETAVQVQAP